MSGSFLWLQYTFVKNQKLKQNTPQIIYCLLAENANGGIVMKGYLNQ